MLTTNDKIPSDENILFKENWLKTKIFQQGQDKEKVMVVEQRASFVRR